MKTLKFSKDLIPDILSGLKTITWRCFDDKDLKEGEEVLFLEHESKKPFAKAMLTEVEKKTFGELNEEDKKGHEEFKNKEEMFKTYSSYYKTEITPGTPLKIIKFKILIKI
jgi:hypothetical protein